MSKSAPWISVEGVDGAGKSSHISSLIQSLEKAGFVVVSTREPGGTDVGERLRTEILNTPMALQTEVLLAFASRAEHLDKVIRPALANGSAVVCDRFTDSTYAYQGCGEGYPLEQIQALEQMVHGDIRPDLTLVFDLPIEYALQRLGKTGKTPDKFERQSSEYFNRVRSGYLDLAQNEPQRVKIIDSRLTWEEVNAQALSTVQEFLAAWDTSPARSKIKP